MQAAIAEAAQGTALQQRPQQPPLQLEPAASQRQGRQATQGRAIEELLGTL